MQFRGYCEWNYGRAWPFCLNCVPIIYISDNITLEDMIKFDGKFLREKVLRKKFRGKIFARKNFAKKLCGKNFAGKFSRDIEGRELRQYFRQYFRNLLDRHCPLASIGNRLEKPVGNGSALGGGAARGVGMVFYGAIARFTLGTRRSATVAAAQPGFRISPQRGE